jgi:hypothetical protein
MKLFLLLSSLASIPLTQAQANIPIHPLTSPSDPYFSDPFHVANPYSSKIFIAGTTHNYLTCSGTLQSQCASRTANDYANGESIKDALDNAGAKLCGAAGIHPFLSGSKDGGQHTRSWDAVVTLHVTDQKECDGIKGWSVIVHAHPENGNQLDTPPSSWIGDKVLVDSFSKDVDANYDGKYFRTPSGDLYLIYQKQHKESREGIKRDGVVAQPMSDPKTLDGDLTWLLLPDENLNSENYVLDNGGKFKLIETGNMRAINGKFIIAYSVGAFNDPAYKIGIAYSDTFLPKAGQQYRKVKKINPANLWGSKANKEVYYLLQASANHDSWHFVRDQVLAPGVPTVAKLGENDGWVLTFAGYDPDDAPREDGKFQANHRRPYFIELEVNIPHDVSVEDATDEEMQEWIRPVHG